MNANMFTFFCRACKQSACCNVNVFCNFKADLGCHVVDLGSPRNDRTTTSDSYVIRYTERSSDKKDINILKIAISLLEHSTRRGNEKSSGIGVREPIFSSPNHRNRYRFHILDLTYFHGDVTDGGLKNDSLGRNAYDSSVQDRPILQRDYLDGVRIRNDKLYSYRLVLGTQ